MLAAVLLGATGGLVIYCWRYDRQLKRERLAREAHWRDQPRHVRLVDRSEVEGVEGDG